MGVVERTLLSLSGERRRLRSAADELESDDADAHLVSALRRAELELGALYKNLFQGTYFYVSESELENASSAHSLTDDEQAEEKSSGRVDVPDPTDELRLFKAEEANDSLKK